MTAVVPIESAKSAAAEIRPERVGVLLVNLGTPDTADAGACGSICREFLSDRRVIEDPALKWWPILNVIILTVRPGRKARDYQKIWNTEENEGPLKTITRSQAEKLAAASPTTHIEVDWAMRYANPSTASRIEALKARGCDRILLVPLYPQYAAATSATACDEAFRALMRMRWQPTVRVAPSYHDDPAISRRWRFPCAATSRRARFQARGHHRHLPRHAAVLPRAGRSLSLPVPEDLAPVARRARAGATKWLTTFQSRFGSDPWLQPYTDETVKRLARKG